MRVGLRVTVEAAAACHDSVKTVARHDGRMTHTPMRAVRIDDSTWQQSKARAEREHRSLSDVIRVALRAYADGRYDAIEPKRRRAE